MKKCMIAAVAAVVAGGAFAACDYDPKEVSWAYTWKFTGKTTEGYLIRGTSGTSNACGLGGGGTAGGAIRVPTSLKIQGYTAYCTPDCGADGFKNSLAETQEVFWQTKPEKTSFYGGVTLEVSNIIGKKAKQYEIAGKASFNDAGYNKYELVFAGLGKYDTRNERVSSASGNFAGTLEYPHVANENNCNVAGVWNCGLSIITDPVDSVAFGKWNVKFNKKAAKKLTDNRADFIIGAVRLPKWVKPLNLNPED